MTPFILNSQVLTDPATTMSDICLLPDKRELGFARYGSEDGPQIFYLHGLPGSRLEGKAFFEKHLSKFGAGLIGVERPGIGLSSQHPGGTVSDHARDVLHLAEHLGLEEWRVIGVSGGSPFALACARHHPPQRLRGVAICAGMGPYSHTYEGMALATKLTLLMFRFAPWLCHLVYRPIYFLQNMTSDEKLVDMLQKNFAKPSRFLPVQQRDVPLFQDRELQGSLIASTKEHFRQGFGGHMQDGQCIVNDWDFRVEDIEFRPIQLWHGREDINCPLQMSEKTAAILGDGVELNVVDETHLSSSVNCAERILKRLLET